MLNSAGGLCSVGNTLHFLGVPEIFPTGVLFLQGTSEFAPVEVLFSGRVSGFVKSQKFLHLRNRLCSERYCLLCLLHPKK